MKHIWKQITCLAMAGVFILGLLPAAAAAIGADVLQTLGHASASASVPLNSGDRDITLYVPASYSSTTLNLSQGLDFSYDTDQYQDVIAVPSGVATVGGDPVDLTVSYALVGGGGGSTIYQVSVRKADPVAAVFTGSITRSSLFPAVLSFSASDFTQKYTPHDSGAMTHIIINGSNLITGTLLYNGSAYIFGQAIALADIPKLSFSAVATGTVTYLVSACAAGKTDTPIGSVLLNIQIESMDTPTITGSLSKSIAVGGSAAFSLSDFAENFILDSGSLSYIEITPDPTLFGSWYAEGTAFTEPKRLTAATIGTLRFAGAAPGTASFRWRVSNQAGYSDYGAGAVTVTSPALVLSSYTGSRMVKGSARTLSASSLPYSPSTYTVKLVKIVSIPASGDATLTLNTALAADSAAGYPAVAAGRTLPAGTVIPYSYLSALVLTTKSGSKLGSVSFSWAATTEDVSDAHTVWSNTASYTVPFATGGTVNYSGDVNSPVTLAAADFASSFSSSSGLTLSYVTFTLPQATAGKLYYNYTSPSSTGTAVSSSTKYYRSSTPNLSLITFVPASNYTGTATIAYKAYASDGAYCEGSLVIQINNSAGGTVTYTGDRAAPITLDANDFKNAFKNATGEVLSYVTFSLPSSTYGKLYYRYYSDYDYEAAVSSSTKYYINETPYLSYVTFVPQEDYAGDVSIVYYGRSVSGSSYQGKLKLTLADSPGGIVLYSANKNTPIRLEASDFATAFISATGSSLSSIKFTLPAAAAGKLYTDYDASSKSNKAVSSGTVYYLNSTPNVSDITFVPTADYIGTVTIAYTGSTAGGVSYAGKCKIFLADGVGGTVSYTTDADTPVDLRGADFYSAFSSFTGEPLSYVTFTLPSSTYGRLYYNYSYSGAYDSAVTAGTRYYVTNTPSLSDITFVPNSNYAGSVLISYTGYTPEGASYAGRLKITVDGGELNTVYYSTRRDTPVSLVSSHFSTAFSQSTGKSLSYVKFTLPSSVYGKLYLNYSSSGTYGSTVSSSTKYYTYSSPSLSSISFVPAEDYYGTVSVRYTGYTSGGDGYSGTVEISVADNSAGTVTCSMLKNKTLTLDADAFNASFKNRTGSALYSVKFTLPATAKGRLYYRYTSSNGNGSAVSESTRYYRSSSPGISDVTFVPAQNYTGIVSVDYSAYDSAGNLYDGLLIITVSDSGRYFSDVRSGYSWAEEAVNYLYLAGVVTGTPDGLYHPGNEISRGDFMLMLYRGFSLEDAAASGFSDVPVDSYYYSAITAARALGIAQGSGSRFFPDSAITRQDAATLLLRTMNVMGRSPEAGTDSDLRPYADRGQISSYAKDAMAALVRAGVMEGSGSYLSPTGNLSRAEMASLLYRVLTQ